MLGRSSPSSHSPWPALLQGIHLYFDLPTHLRRLGYSHLPLILTPLCRPSSLYSQSLDTPCYKGIHLYFALLLGLPGIVLFAVGIPLASALFLRFKRERLEEAHFSLRFGFMYEGESLKKC